MAVVSRKLKNGQMRYFGQITRRAVGYSENGPRFDTEAQAEKWLKKREPEVDAAIAEGSTPMKRKLQRRTLTDAIDAYIEGTRRDLGDTKKQVLNAIKEYPIAKMRCDAIQSHDVVQFVRSLYERPGLNSPSTAGNYFAHLSAVFTEARPMYGIPLDPKVMRDARVVCKKHELIGDAEERDRRPSFDELDKLMQHFKTATDHNPRCIPMHVICAFALFSTRRQAEICRITWDDYHEEKKGVLVRRMKNPGDKRGRDTWVELPDPCTSIIAKQPRRKQRIFPFNSDTVSRRFTEACKFLEIEDLHFHDLRHEGTSRLAEMGRTVPQLASVTGHRSMKNLDRYTHVRNLGDIYDGWKWLDAVT